nr:hypothetical protein [uncultured Mucilaginibacter sp.]
MSTLKGIILLLIIGLIGCSPKASFLTISSKIYKKNGGANDKSPFHLSSHKNKARMKAYALDTTSLLEGEIDTLYFLEGYNLETATFYGTIWNKRKSINYSYFKENLSFLNRSIFSDYQIKLVTDWDLSGIRHEEKVNGNWLDNNLQIGAIRTIKDGKKVKIDEIYFKDSFDPNRDK